jgi:hypothetical protein
VNVPANATLTGRKLYGSSGRVAFINQTSSSYVNHASTSVDTYQNGTVPYTPTSAAGYEIKGSNPFVASASIVSHVGEMPFKSHRTSTVGSNVVTLYTNGGQTATNLQEAPGDIVVKVPVPDTILYPSGMYVNSGRVSAADGIAGFSNGLYSNGIACTYPRSYSTYAYVTQTITDGTVTTTTKFNSTFFTTTISTVGGKFRGSGKEKYVSLYQTSTHTSFATYPSAPYYFNGHIAYFKSGAFYTTPISIIQPFSSSVYLTSFGTITTATGANGYTAQDMTYYSVTSLYHIWTYYGGVIGDRTITNGYEGHYTDLSRVLASYVHPQYGLETFVSDSYGVGYYATSVSNHGTTEYVNSDTHNASVTYFDYNGTPYAKPLTYYRISTQTTIMYGRGDMFTSMPTNIYSPVNSWTSTVATNSYSTLHGNIEKSTVATIDWYISSAGYIATMQSINIGTAFWSPVFYGQLSIGDYMSTYVTAWATTKTYSADWGIVTVLSTRQTTQMRSTRLELPSMLNSNILTNYALDGTQHYKGVAFSLWSNHTDLRTYTSRLVCVSPATITNTLVTGTATNFSNGVYGCACRMVAPTFWGSSMINITLTSVMSFTGDGIYSNAGRKFSVKDTLVYPIDITGTYLAYGSYVTITLPAVNTNNTEWINSKIQGFDEMNDCFGDRLMEIETDY